MFAVGLKETHSHVIKITDFQFEPVRALVEYMYMPDTINEKTDADGTDKSSGAGYGGLKIETSDFSTQTQANQTRFRC
jgi:hypothetical protein